MRCGQCYEHIKEGRLKEPACSVRECTYSELSLVELGDWLNMFWALKTDIITENGLGLHMLRKTKGLDGETIGLFVELNGILHEHRKQELERTSQARRAR